MKILNLALYYQHRILYKVAYLEDFTHLPRRLSENPHLLCYPHPSSLRRTYMYASFLGISDALHMEIFHQPPIALALRQAPRKDRVVSGPTTKTVCRSGCLMADKWF